MATLTKFDCFVENLAEGVHNLGSNTLKIALTNTLPVVGNTVIANITEIAYTTFVNGTTTGRDVVVTSSAQASGLYKLIASDLVLTANATTPTFRYVVLYNSTAANGPLIGWYDYGAGLSLNASETLTIDFDATNGILTLQ